MQLLRPTTRLKAAPVRMTGLIASIVGFSLFHLRPLISSQMVYCQTLLSSRQAARPFSWLRRSAYPARHILSCQPYLRSFQSRRYPIQRTILPSPNPTPWPTKTPLGPNTSESCNTSSETSLPFFTPSLPEVSHRISFLIPAVHKYCILPGARGLGNAQVEVTNPALFKSFKAAVRVWTFKITTALVDPRFLDLSQGGVKSKDRRC